jgi:hypothetical protein
MPGGRSSTTPFDIAVTESGLEGARPSIRDECLEGGALRRRLMMRFQIPVSQELDLPSTMNHLEGGALRRRLILR